MLRSRERGAWRTRSVRAALVSVVLVAVGCGDDDDTGPSETSAGGAATTEAPAETTTQATTAQDVVDAAQARVDAAQSGVDAAQDGLTTATEQFCSDAESYVEVLDRYGKLFTDDAATVGDVQTLGADLVEPRETVSTAADEVGAAKADAGRRRTGAHRRAGRVGGRSRHGIERPDELDRAGHDDVHDDRPAGHDRARPAGRGRPGPGRRGHHGGDTADRGVGRVQLGGARPADRLAHRARRCRLPDRRAAGRRRRVGAGLHHQHPDAAAAGRVLRGRDRRPLRTADGRRPSSSCRPRTACRETGYVDQATARALEAKLADLGQQAASAEATQTAALQTVLTLTGFWHGPIDGQWTDELTDALVAFQNALGVAPTGAVDAATLAAFEQALGDLRAAATATTTIVAPTTPAAAATDRAGPVHVDRGVRTRLIPAGRAPDLRTCVAATQRRVATPVASHNGRCRAESGVRVHPRGS